MNNNITIPKQEDYNSIIDNIDKGGAKSVHFLVDFDKTLTKAFIKGKEFPSLIALLRNDTAILGEEYAQKAHALYDYYSVIEKDPHVNRLEKAEKMSEWWRKHQELLVVSGLKKEHIENAVNSGYLEFREGIEKCIRTLEQRRIPLVIISANGIGGDSIKMFFEKHGVMSDNIHIISNVLEFDNSGVAIGYEEKVIHSFNKTEAVIKDYPEVYEKIKERTNVILMGDSLGDPDMIDGFDYNALLKVGFFNNRPDVSPEEEPELFKKFCDSYDVILSGDSDVSFVNSILEKID